MYAQVYISLYHFLKALMTRVASVFEQPFDIMAVLTFVHMAGTLYLGSVDAQGLASVKQHP